MAIFIAVMGDGTYHFIPADKQPSHVRKNGTAALRPDTYEALVYAVSRELEGENRFGRGFDSPHLHQMEERPVSSFPPSDGGDLVSTRRQVSGDTPRQATDVNSANP